MTRFYVGQRVRIIACHPSRSGYDRVGEEAVITVVYSGANFDCEIQLLRDGRLADAHYSALSPILPPGQIHQPANMTISELLPFLKECERV